MLGVIKVSSTPLRHQSDFYRWLSAVEKDSSDRWLSAVEKDSSDRWLSAVEATVTSFYFYNVFHSYIQTTNVSLRVGLGLMLLF